MRLSASCSKGGRCACARSCAGKPARFLPPGSNMAAPSVCPEVPSRLLAAMTPSAAVGPGTRRVRVIRWRRRNKQEFPWTSCQNRVAWASWKSEMGLVISFC
ncbi:PREDICTED: uncharacterized protein LOC106503629 isoform X2 [Capra hircus]|uniref:uncharacterized protein LOC106503629 isoform X2 n=1 Tax=Capra hircus TaxID=9925 RepID=UPI0008471F84|nr:PREDICTED: uncharacterized protein LOC106503629 isoform X2 [Capra hircus]